MKVVFCSLNSRYIHSSLAPWCLLAAVGHRCDETVDAVVLEGTVNEPPEAVLQRLLEKTPDAVGFCCYIWNITRVREIAARLKAELPRCFVFFGGPEVSYCPDAVLRENPAVDAVVGGEGEYPVSRLMTALSHGEEWSDIPGISRRVGGTVVTAAPYMTDEEPESPYVPAYFEALDGRIAYLETSRGCPFSCAFCLSGRCGGVRFYQLERVYREILLLAASGTQTIKLVDRTFNANRERARSIIRFIIDEYGKGIPAGVCFHFEIGGDLLDEDTFVLLSEAPKGLFQMEIGLQSFHAPTLAAIRRKTDITHLVDNIRKLVAAGNVHTHIDLIAGLPEETMETFAAGLNTALSLHPHMLQLGFLKLLHGASLRETAAGQGCCYSEQPPYEVRETAGMTVADLAVLHGVADALDRLYNSGRFRRTLTYAARYTGWTMFDLLCRIAAENPPEMTAGMSLEAYTERVFACLSRVTDKEELRDAMVCDWLSSNPAGLLPVCLRRFPEQTKILRRTMESDPRFARPAGVRRGCACLSDGRTLVYADHCSPDPVTGRYALNVFEEACLSRPYRTLLFDLDGTITDPAEGITNSVAYALEKLGITVTDKNALLRFIGPPLLDSFRDFYGLDDRQAQQALRWYREYYAVTGIYENVMYEGMPELLWDLKRHGYRLLVATSKPELYARRIFEQFGLTDCFHVIAGSDMAEKRADKAQVVAYALAQAGLYDRSEAVMIGDRCFDVAGARAEGLPCIGVLFGYGSRPELEQAGATHIVESVTQLRTLLLEGL